MHTIYENIKQTLLDAPIVRSASFNGNSLDHDGYEINAHSIAVGVDGALDGSNYWTFKLQESANDSDWTDVTDNECFTIVNDDTVDHTNDTVVINNVLEDDVIVQFEYRGLLQYSRIVATETGTLTTPIGITGLQERASIAPVVGRSA